MQTMQIFD